MIPPSIDPYRSGYRCRSQQGADRRRADRRAHRRRRNRDLNNTPDSDVGTAVTFGPLVRLNPRPAGASPARSTGIGPICTNPAGGEEDFRAHCRAAVHGRHRLHAGPAEDAGQLLDRHGALVQPGVFRGQFTDAAGSSIEAKTSFAIRPGISITQTLAPRVGFTAYGGYMFNRPRGDLPEQHRPAGPGSVARRFDRAQRRHGVFGVLEPVSISGGRAAVSRAFGRVGGSAGRLGCRRRAFVLTSWQAEVPGMGE